MTAPHLGTTLQPPFTRAVSMQALLADQPPVRDVGTNLDEIRVGRRLVVLDDDPTGTQCVADLPVLTRWSVPDLQWAFQQPTTGFFVLTNTRSLPKPTPTNATGVKSRIDIFVKDMGIVTAVGRSSHVPLPLAAAAQQLFFDR